jgi:hypothetical protein
MTVQRRPHIEDAFMLDVAKVMAAVAMHSGFLILGEHPLIGRSAASRCIVHFRLQLAQARGTLTLSYYATVYGKPALVNDTIQMEATTPNYGGRRWWFRCALTRKRAAKLYLFPNNLRFCHRTGIEPGPTYLSQRVSGMDKVYRRMAALRQSLPGQGTIRDPLRRPPGMHLSTYLRHLRRDRAIWNSPQNTLLAWFGSYDPGNEPSEIC